MENKKFDKSLINEISDIKLMMTKIESRSYEGFPHILNEQQIGNCDPPCEFPATCCGIHTGGNPPISYSCCNGICDMSLGCQPHSTGTPPPSGNDGDCDATNTGCRNSQYNNFDAYHACDCAGVWWGAISIGMGDTSCCNNTSTGSPPSGGTPPGGTGSQGSTLTGGHGSCFTAGVKVKMADGTDKNIEDVKIDEEILGQNGVNTVVDYDRPKLGDRKLYSFNGGKAFVTDEHPFMTEGGWKSIDPGETLKENPELTVDILNIGDVIITNSESITIESVESHEGNAEDIVYNFNLDGDNSYYADGYLVHNKQILTKGPQEPVPPKPIVHEGNIPRRKSFLSGRLVPSQTQLRKS